MWGCSVALWYCSGRFYASSGALLPVVDPSWAILSSETAADGRQVAFWSPHFVGLGILRNEASNEGFYKQPMPYEEG